MKGFFIFHVLIHMFLFSKEKNANQNIEDLFSRLMEKQRGKEGENSEKETFLDIQTYTFNKSVHLTFKKT